MLFCANRRSCGYSDHCVVPSRPTCLGLGLSPACEDCQGPGSCLMLCGFFRPAAAPCLLSYASRVQRPCLHWFLGRSTQQGSSCLPLSNSWWSTAALQEKGISSAPGHIMEPRVCPRCPWESIASVKRDTEVPFLGSSLPHWCTGGSSRCTVMPRGVQQLA